MKKVFAMILMLVLLCTAAFAESNPVILTGEDVPPLPERVDELIGGIPVNAEALQERADVQEMEALLQAWDAKGMISDLKEKGTHTFDDMGYSWIGCYVDGKDMTTEAADGRVTTTMKEKEPFTVVELETGNDERDLFLSADLDETTGELLDVGVILFVTVDDAEYGHFWYTTELRNNNWTICIYAGQGKVVQTWEFTYTADGQVEKKYVEEDLTNADA